MSLVGTHRTSTGAGRIAWVLALGAASFMAPAAACGLDTQGLGAPGSGGTSSTTSGGGHAHGGEGGQGIAGAGGLGGAGAQGGAGGVGGSMGAGGGQGGVMSVCGDGAVTGSEECDDTNTQPYDRCDATCHIEHPDDCPGTPVALSTGTRIVINDTTAGANDTLNDVSGPTACPAGIYPGADLIYAVTPDADGTIKATLTATYPAHFLHAKAACAAGTDLACAYNGSSATADSISFAATAGVTYYLIVDSFGSTGGPFNLTIDF
jgi:cysteine-rich repeat protein